LQRKARLAMRFLHSRHGDDRAGHCEAGALPDQRRHSSGTVRQHLPLYRLRRHRRGHHSGTGSRTGAGSHTRRDSMKMTGEQLLDTSVEVAWSKLFDPDVLMACIPGCESLEIDEDGRYQATVVMAIGPLK